MCFSILPCAALPGGMSQTAAWWFWPGAMCFLGLSPLSLLLQHRVVELLRGKRGRSCNDHSCKDILPLESVLKRQNPMLPRELYFLELTIPPGFAFLFHTFSCTHGLLVGLGSQWSPTSLDKVVGHLCLRGQFSFLPVVFPFILVKLEK